MKLLVLPVACVLQLACSTTAVQTVPGPAEAIAPPADSVRFSLGYRQLDDSNFKPVDEQGVFGFEFAHEPRSAPLGFEFGLQVGSWTKSESVPLLGDTDITSAVFELYGGVHKTFLRDSTLQPYIGAGITLVTSYYETAYTNSTVSDDDSSLGLYVHGGLQACVAKNLIVGADLRGVFGTNADLFGVSGDADYEQVAAFVGFTF